MNVTRREFLSQIGIGALLVAAGTGLAAFARLMQPNVTTSAPGPIEISAADAYALGTLTFVENAWACVGRDAREIFAILVVCPHLGCTRAWRSTPLHVSVMRAVSREKGRP